MMKNRSFFHLTFCKPDFTEQVALCEQPRTRHSSPTLHCLKDTIRHHTLDKRLIAHQPCQKTTKHEARC